MFHIDINTTGANLYDGIERVNHSVLLNQAINLFNQTRWNSAFENIKHVFFGSFNMLLDLESVPANMVRVRHYGGIRPVGIDKICGTLGRTHDFNRHFQPLNDRIRDRWVSIAVARSQNIPLKPVELIQVNGCYFVKDGHHRISVARARGESAVDAEITVWEVCCALPWEKQPAARSILQPIS